MDMLIKLYAIGKGDGPRTCPADVVIRQPIGPEHERIFGWVGKEFGGAWASEARVALNNRPPSLRMAMHAKDLVGFACYDATARGFFGPIGLLKHARGQGTGAALLLAALRNMRAMGYGYAIVGAVGPTEFFRRVAGAIEIPDSTPGLYAYQWKD